MTLINELRIRRGSALAAYLASIAVASASVGLFAPPPDDAATLPSEGAGQSEPEVEYLRVHEVKDKLVSLQTSAWEYRPIDVDGPSITLVAVAHIGEAQFYRDLQDTLDAFDVVLYESVTPPGINVDPGDDDDARREVTEAGIQFVGAALEQYRDRVGHFPVDLEALKTFANRSDSRSGHFVELASTDAWGNEVAYGQMEDGDAFVLVSLGRDGKAGGEGADADISYHALPTSPWLAVGEDDNLQAQLAEALGLAFQLDAIRYDRDNWRVSDMAIDDVERELAARGSAFSVGSTLAGSGLSGQIVKVLLNVLRMADAFLDGMIADTMKVMMIEVLGNEELVDSALAEFDAAMGEVIVDLRNQVVVDDLAALLEDPGETETVGVFYGAAHMGDLAERMKDQLGYVPAEDAAKWFTAIEVNLEESQITPADLRQMRMMMRFALQQQGR